MENPTKNMGRRPYVEDIGGSFSKEVPVKDERGNVDPEVPIEDDTSSFDPEVPTEDDISSLDPEGLTEDDTGSSDSQTIEINPSDTVIAVMGITGVGKSTFINHFADKKAIVGHELESCTWKVEIHPCTLPDGTKLYLVDTPGFDDTYTSDTDILREIASWLDQAFSQKIKLTGIVYLHRIFDNRLGGSAMKNLNMFKALCGDQGLGIVVLATTQWSKVTAEEGERREKELCTNSNMWERMIRKGSTVWRQDRDKESALEIIQYLIKLKRRVNLAIQEEMDKGVKLEETAAGQEVHAELERQKKDFEWEIREMRTQMAEAIAARDRERQQDLKELIAEAKEKRAEALEDKRKLMADREELRRQKEEESRQERKRYQEELRLKDIEIAKGEMELRLVHEMHKHDLEKQKLELDAQQARANQERVHNESKMRVMEKELQRERDARDNLEKKVKGCVVM